MEIIHDLFHPKEQQEPEYEQEPVDNRPQVYPYEQQNVATLPNSDPEFMKWLFDLKERVVTPLKFAWMGYELDINGHWVKKLNSKPLMNMDGVNWCTEFIESYINPAYIISNYNDKWFNYTMRIATNVIINNLTSRHREFALNKLDIENISLQIESKVMAILLGARADGYRAFFGKTRQEHVMTQKFEGPQNQNKGLFNMFGKKDQRQQLAPGVEY